MGATVIIGILLLVLAGELIVLSIKFKDMGLLAATAAIAALVVLICTLAFIVDVHRLKAEKTGGG